MAYHKPRDRSEEFLAEVRHKCGLNGLGNQVFADDDEVEVT